MSDGVDCERGDGGNENPSFCIHHPQSTIRHPTLGPDFPHCRAIYNSSVALRLNRMTDRQLLDLRLCDLPLQIKGSHLEQRLEKLYRELDARSLAFRPH